MTEAFKLATYAFANMDNYTMFTQTLGVNSYTFPAEKKSDCLVCGQTRKVVEMARSNTLAQLVEKLKDENDLAAPSLTTYAIDGAPKTLFIEHIDATSENLSRRLDELGLVNAQEISVTDKTYVSPVTVKLKFLEV